MGSVCILHASLTEYVLFFGSAVDTVGHSGGLCKCYIALDMKLECKVSVFQYFIVMATNPQEYFEYWFTCCNGFS